MAQDGLFINFYGPDAGRRHGIYLLRESRLLQRLGDERGGAFCLYGDPVYPN